MDVNSTMSDKKVNELKANCYIKMGNICTMLSAHNDAITYYTSAIQLLEKQNRYKNSYVHYL